MTSQLTIRRELRRLREITGTKKPHYIYVTMWHPPSVPLPKNTVKVEGEFVTLKIESKR